VEARDLDERRQVQPRPQAVDALQGAARFDVAQVVLVARHHALDRIAQPDDDIAAGGEVLERQEVPVHGLVATQAPRPQRKARDRARQPGHRRMAEWPVVVVPEEGRAVMLREQRAERGPGGLRNVD
jgi:hypothetical protein